MPQNISNSIIKRLPSKRLNDTRRRSTETANFCQKSHGIRNAVHVNMNGKQMNGERTRKFDRFADKSTGNLPGVADVRNRLARQHVGAFVEVMAGVTAHPMPAHLVRAERGIEALPQDRHS